MHSLMDAARGLKLMEGEILSSNAGMPRLARKLGFHAQVSEDAPDIVMVSKKL